MSTVHSSFSPQFHCMFSFFHTGCCFSKEERAMLTGKTSAILFILVHIRRPIIINSWTSSERSSKERLSSHYKPVYAKCRSSQGTIFGTGATARIVISTFKQPCRVWNPSILEISCVMRDTFSQILVLCIILRFTLSLPLYSSRAQLSGRFTVHNGTVTYLFKKAYFWPSWLHLIVCLCTKSAFATNKQTASSLLPEKAENGSFSYYNN